MFKIERVCKIRFRHFTFVFAKEKIYQCFELKMSCLLSFHKYLHAPGYISVYGFTMGKVCKY